MLIVTVMGGGTAVDLEAWASTYGLSSPVASDTANIAGAFGIQYLPTQQLIGRGSIIKMTNQAKISDADIEAALDEVVY